jgi:protocatechuate 3,4-dioxygenase beta subunit
MRRGLIAACLLLLLPPGAGAQSPCGAPTPPDMEGPFYTPGAPMRASLVEPGAKGERVILTGRVLGPDCKPVAGALLDFWQADEKGEYDNKGFRYRGKVTADGDGRYRLETILPAEYPGRPRHLHVKVQRPGGRALTTQLYFPGEPHRQNPALVVKAERREGVREATFDFVVR